MPKSDPTQALLEAPRTCESCAHVLGGRIDRGVMLTDQRCLKYRAGKNPLLTWTAIHNPKKCGPERRSWDAAISATKEGNKQ